MKYSVLFICSRGVILLKMAVSHLYSCVPYSDTSVEAAHWRKHFWNDDLWNVNCFVAVGQSSQQSNDLLVFPQWII